MNSIFIPSDIHTSILYKEAGELLNIATSQRHIDATLGMGGHVHYFLTCNPHLHVLGFDQDSHARKLAAQRLAPWKEQVQIIPENFETIGDHKDFKPTSILFDIGVSSLQFDDESRGFSFRFDSPLDMRMDTTQKLTAATIVNTWSEEDLLRIFRDYGEEKHAGLIVRKILEDRDDKPFTTTAQLADFIERVKPKRKGRESGGNSATLVFQALRIAVNRELEVLSSALESAIDILEVGGRLAVISFHSLEDRIVKQCFEKYISKEKKQKYKPENYTPDPQFPLISITKKPVIPSPEEIATNPRSRSAKMRIVEKIL